MISFFAAVSQFATSDIRKQRVNNALQTLKRVLEDAPPGTDPLGLATFDNLRSGIAPRKVNVGVATRRLLTNGFKEYFREAGEVPLSDCWTLAVE